MLERTTKEGIGSFTLEEMGLESKLTEKELKVIREGDLNTLLNVALGNALGLYEERDLKLMRARIGEINGRLEAKTSP